MKNGPLALPSSLRYMAAASVYGVPGAGEEAIIGEATGFTGK